MKAKINKMLIAIFIIVLLWGMKISISKGYKLLTTMEEDLTFAVLSDIHTNTGKFTNAIDDLYEINPYIDAVVLNGDTVDEGLDEQYDEMQKAIDKNKEKLPINLLINIGNHELYNYSSGTKDQSEIDKRINKYLNFSGNEKTYNDRWINGYHFISLGTDSVDINTINDNIAFISDEQVKWLEKKLKEGYKKGKPIFVFLHQPLDMKFFKHDKEGSNKSKEIRNILSKYPEVVLFTSHTHITPEDEIQKELPFKIVNTGAVSFNYVSDNSEKGFKENHKLSNGIYVEVKDNEVNIMGRSFNNEEWLYKN